MPKFRDLTGKTFGRLTVINCDGKNRHNQFLWTCRCACGVEKSICGTHLVTGGIQSCGCYRKEVATVTGHTHGIENTKKGKNKNRVSAEQNFWTVLYNGYKTDSKKRGYEWSLSKDDFIFIAKQNCHYCGALPSINYRARTAYLIRCKHQQVEPDLAFADSKIGYANGLDRQHNLLGYIKPNLVPCCNICNIAKSNLSLDEWYNWIKRITEFQLEVKIG